MALFSDDDLNKIRDAVDVVDYISRSVSLKQSGHLFKACCPFHEEKTPSFIVDSTKQSWHCYGCGEGGDIFTFVQKTQNLNFPESVIFLARQYNIPVKADDAHYSANKAKKQKLYDTMAAAIEFYHLTLTKDANPAYNVAREYLKQRGFNIEIAKRWKLGFAPGSKSLVTYLNSHGFTRANILDTNLGVVNAKDALNDRFFNRIMFPVYDLMGNPIAFGGRVIDGGEPKYLNTSETDIFHKSSNLFGLDKAKNDIVASNYAIIVEGYTDVITLSESGIKNVVATLGTALTAQHIKILKRFTSRIVFLFDGDSAGQKAARRALEFIDSDNTIEGSAKPVKYDVVLLEDNLDPADYVNQKGKDALVEKINNAQNLVQFCLERAVASCDKNDDLSFQNCFKECIEIISPLKNSINSTKYVNYIADALNISYNIVAQALKKSKGPVAARYKNESQASFVPEQTNIDSISTELSKTKRREIQAQIALLMQFVKDPSNIASYKKHLDSIKWNGNLQDFYAYLVQEGASISSKDLHIAALNKLHEYSSLITQHLNSSGNFEKAEVENLIFMFRIQNLQSEIDEKKRMLHNANLQKDKKQKLMQEIFELESQLNELRKTKLV
ncbi:MAG: DNA primase [Coriobacteriales bacterium]|nr:DNA primase [Coriobacteriales bacterium]